MRIRSNWCKAKLWWVILVNDNDNDMLPVIVLASMQLSSPTRRYFLWYSAIHFMPSRMRSVSRARNGGSAIKGLLVKAEIEYVFAYARIPWTLTITVSISSRSCDLYQLTQISCAKVSYFALYAYLSYIQLSLWITNHPRAWIYSTIPALSCRLSMLQLHWL